MAMTQITQAQQSYLRKLATEKSGDSMTLPQPQRKSELTELMEKNAELAQKNELLERQIVHLGSRTPIERPPTPDEHQFRILAPFEHRVEGIKTLDEAEEIARRRARSARGGTQFIYSLIKIILPPAE